MYFAVFVYGVCFVVFDAESSACPGFGVRLWPLAALLIGSIYLLSHFDFVRRFRAFHVVIALFFVWMILISDWDAPLDVRKAFLDTKSELRF